MFTVTQEEVVLLNPAQYKLYAAHETPLNLYGKVEQPFVPNDSQPGVCLL